MILVDSSAFIEYYRPAGLPEARTKVAEAIAADLVAVNGIIRVEILAFAPNEAELRKLAADFDAFHPLDLEPRDFDRAVELGFALRRRAITVPTTDLIIAASAIRAGATLYHLDSHFDQIAEVSALRVENLRGDTLRRGA